MDKFPNEYEEDKDLLQKLYKLEYKLAEKDFLIAVLEEKNNQQKDMILNYKECCKKLEAKNEELVSLTNGENMEWISVEDRLPETGKYCLVINESRDRAHFSMFCANGRFFHDNITHWMPLPEPPKPKAPTFKDVFLKAFTKAKLFDGGTPVVCAKGVFPQIGDYDECCNAICRECWNQLYFETEEEGGEE